MNKLRFTLFLLMLTSALNAQFIQVSEGTNFVVQGASMQINDLDIINNGTFQQRNGEMIWAGKKEAILDGSTPIQFDSLSINNQSSIVLYNDIVVESVIEMDNGILNLYDNNLILPEDKSSLGNETTTGRVISSGKGEIIKSFYGEITGNENIGNLGLTLSAFSNHGGLEIRRGHASVSLPTGESIERYYKISTFSTAKEDFEIGVEYFTDEVVNYTPNTENDIWVRNNGQWKSARSRFFENQEGGELIAKGEFKLTESLITVGSQEDIIAFDNVPTVFTPNDDGANDEFVIPNIDFSGAYQVSIYDKSGKKIYSSANYSKKPWDGTYMGQSMPIGTYLYRIEDSNKVKKSFEGEITIVR